MGYFNHLSPYLSVFLCHVEPTVHDITGADSPLSLLEPGCVNVGYTSLLSMLFSCAFNLIGLLAC